MGGLASQGLAELCCTGSVVHGPCNTADSQGVDHDWTGAERTRTSRVAWATVQPGTWSSWGSSWRLFGRYTVASEADSSSCCERLPAVAKRPERTEWSAYTLPVSPSSSSPIAWVLQANRDEDTNDGRAN